jgi:hypothetical protein
MKATLYAALGAVLLLAALPAEANAVVCAKGVYRAGLAGPRGAVVGRAGRSAVLLPRWRPRLPVTHKLATLRSSARWTIAQPSR